jgi:type I restriction enzyme, S subunit
MKNLEETQALSLLLKSAGIQSLPENWSALYFENILSEDRGISVGVMYPGKHDPHGIPLIKAGDMEGHRINSRPDFNISLEKHHEYRRSAFSGGEILMTLVGNIGQCAVVPPRMIGWNAARAVAVIRLKNSDEAPFIRYFFQTKPIRHLMLAWANTTVQPTLNLKEIKKLPIAWPPKVERDFIAKNLGILDDKIELNRQMNETLEEMARAVFKSWFVDFDPVHAKAKGQAPAHMSNETAALFPAAFNEDGLPEGWSYQTLGDVAENHSTTFDFSGRDDVVFINTGDVLSGRFLHNQKSKIDGLPGQAKKTITYDDILFSEIRPKNNRFAYVDFDASEYVVSTKFMVIRSLGKIHPRLLYQIIKQKETIQEFNIAAESRSGTFPQITFSAVSHLPIKRASKEVEEQYVKFLSPLREKQNLLYEQNQTLAELRDTLLPKLMSGQIRLRNAEQLVEDGTV